MSYRLGDEVLEAIAELCGKLTNFEEDSPIFHHVYKYAVQRLQSADSMFSITRKEIDDRIVGMSDKFTFHGFLKQAADLKMLYERFLGRNVPKEETQNRLTVMKFLFAMSGSPTRYLASLEETYRCGTVEDEEDDDVDWGSYLREGIERWSPPESVESDEWTDDDSESSHVEVTDETESKPSQEQIDANAALRKEAEELNYGSARRKISEQVQNGWFNNNYVCHLPKSSNVDANVAVKWHEYLLECTSGLLKLDRPSILSEYKIVREVIWQLWEPHNGVAYKFSGNKLVPKEDITISSVRPVPFQRYLQEFVPYTEILDDFRNLVKILNIKRENSVQPPDTYKTFCASVRSILAPTKQSLVDLENQICKQDDTMTLLRLANFCRRNFKSAEILKDISDGVLTDYTAESRLECTTSLLRKLHDGILRSVSKSEQDVYLCLYLESLFKYCCIIDNWLNKGEFRDDTEEFPVAVVSKGFSKDWRVRQFRADAMEDGFLKLVYTEVLQIGKNIHLLHQLGKLHLVSEIDSSNRGTLHEEFIDKVLQEITHYFEEYNGTDKIEDEEEINVLEADGFKFPAICPDFCKYATEMDKLENLVDTSDGCLSLAFESFFTEVSAKKALVKPPSLYERISKTTKNIFPAQNMFESIFSDILKSRYSASGHIVKTLLKNNYMLDRHLDLLHHVFLFKDDVIFPFYWKLFDQLDNSKEWGNNIWLTSHLQDVIMDIHPYTYEKLSVIVKDPWREFLDDPLKGSTLFRLQYQIEWPITLVITDVDMQMYKELFFFILQIKWALYTLNHLHFSDIEPKKAKVKETSRVLRLIRGRLKVLRFAFVNIFSSIQHYILGHTYALCSANFVDDYNRSYSVDTLVASHSRFIAELHRKATYLRDYNESSYGYYLLLYNVRKLRKMWKDIKGIDEKELRKCEESYKRCHKMLFDIIHPSNCV